MRFAIPNMLWLLVLIPVIGAGLVWAAGYRRALLGRFGTETVFVKHGIAAIGATTWLRMALFLLAIVALVFALARPQWGYHERQVVTHGVDMMIAVDTSDSMMARDFPPNRLSRAKELLRNLIWEAQGSRVGIVAFAGSAIVMCPLTLDYNMAATALKAVDPSTVSVKGTNIGAAIKSALGAFLISGANDRVLVLLTDGEQLDRPEELDAAVKEAAEQGVKIFAIGLGTQDGATIPTMAGPKRTATGELVQTKLDFDKLEELAEKTGGEAIRAEKIGAGEIAEISAALSKYRGRKQQDKTYRVYHDRYPWFVGAAALLLLAEALLSGVHRLRWSRRKREIATVASLFLILAAAPYPAAAYPGEGYVRSRDALQKYNVGEFDQSAQLYEEAAEVSPQNTRIQFNLGAAAAKAGKVDEARESFGKVYDPENPTLNAYARYGMATIDHREWRKSVADKKEEWAAGAAEGKAPKEEIQQAVDKLKDIITEYKETILTQPDDLDMKANYELAKKDLEELENLLKENQQQQQQQQQEQKQENQEQKQDQQKEGEQDQQGEGEKEQQGQQGQDEQKQGEEGQDQQQPDQKKPEEEQGEQQDQKQDSEGEKKDEQEGEQQQGESDSDNQGDQKDQQPQPDPQGKPTPTPTPSPTPQSTPQPGENKGQGQEPAQQGEPVPIGQMSPTDVDRLLNTLPPEDQQALQLMMGTPTAEQDMEHDW